VFSPSGSGDRPGALTIQSNALSGSTLVPLDGAGGPALTLTPTALVFPSTSEGSISVSQSITVTNSGGATVQLQTPMVSGDYRITANSCGPTLAPASPSSTGATCTVQIAYAPTSACGANGLLTIPANVAGGQVTASLTGVDGSATSCALSISPAPLDFGSVQSGTTTPAQTMTVTNVSSSNVLLGGQSLQGAYAFAPGGTCTANLTLTPAPASGDSCTLLVVFSPVGAGASPGLLTLANNGASGSLTALLDGTGVLPGQLNLSTSLLSFGSIVLGATSPSQTLTVTNSGGSSLDFQTPAYSVSSPEYQITPSLSNACGGILSAGHSCSIQIAFKPTATGDQPATLTVSAGGGAIRQQASLDGSGVAPAALAFTPAALSFGSLQEGQTSPQQAAVLSNTGSVTAQLVLPVVTGDYSIAGSTCGLTLAPSATCTLQITFGPTAAGSRPGMVTVSATNASSGATVVLGGTGTTPPSLVLTPTALVFGATAQGATTAAQNITLANTGSGVINLKPFAITGDYAISADTCTGTPLSPTYSCTLSITFTPTAGGLRTGLLTVSDGTETHTATLSGTGLSPATDTLSVTSLTFGPQVFGTVSTAQSVTLTNSGGQLLLAIATAVTGPFTATNNCGSILGGGLACSIAVSYAPTGPGTQTGQLVISDVIGGAPHSRIVTLTGQGILSNLPYPSAVATPSSLDFNVVVQGVIVNGFAVGATAPAQLVTVTNNGNAPLDGFTAAISAPSFAIVANTCGDTLAVGSNCTLGVTFTPQQPGSVGDLGTLTLSSPSLGSPLSPPVALSGSGEDFQLSVSGSSSDLVTNGQTAPYQLVVTPVGISAGTLTFSCSGLPANSSCTFNPASVQVSAGATGSVGLSIATGLQTIAVRQPPPSPRRSRLWISTGMLAFLLPCLLLRGKARRSWLALSMAIALVFAPAACGVHSSGGTSTATGGTLPTGVTPPGKYSITVTGSFPGAQRTVALTLTVE
jgi:hypothetical protein